MSNIKLLRAPGFIYDLYFIFGLKFNATEYAEELDNGRSKDLNLRAYNEVLAQFENVPDELYVFFHRIENRRMFMATHYFMEYKSHFSNDFDFQFLLNELRDQKKVIRNMIRFYLHGLSDEEVEECFETNSKLFLNIRNSKYSAEEKSRLYEFFLDPCYYIDMLRYELIQKEAQLSDYYKDNYEKIIDVHNKSTFDVLKKVLTGIRDLEFLTNSNENMYASYCLLNKYLIYNLSTEKDFISILGCDYLSYANVNKDVSNDLKLDDFGNAIGDVSRAKILWFILEKGEATCKDLEKAFDFSGSTSYHHITLMTRAGVLKTRNEGKTVYYSINRKYFDVAISVLNKFATKNSQR